MTRRVIQFRVSEDQDRSIRRAADDAGMGLTEYILSRLGESTEAQKPVARKVAESLKDKPLEPKAEPVLSGICPRCTRLNGGRKIAGCTNCK